ncbi:MAG: thioesterase family protein [Pseudomonadota bacterium]
MSDAAHGDSRIDDAPIEETRERFRYWLTIPTRWMDNDIYGHVNNVIYYSYFDTLVNSYLIEAGKLDIHGGDTIGFAVETFCQFKDSFVFPDKVEGGLRVAKLGTSSVRYEIGLFKTGRNSPAATGHFVHVFVDRKTQRPVPIPEPMRTALAALLLPA